MTQSDLKIDAAADMLPTDGTNKARVKSRMGYLAYAFFIPATIMYLIYIAMEIHPFGNGSVLVLDLNGQYVYFYEALRNFVYGDASLLYSFSRSLGGEFLGIYAYYIASPFSYIVALFPQSMVLEALLVIFLLKTGLCGFTFGFYLHKTGKSKSKIATIIFSCLYALSAYAVVQQHNSMWIDAVMWLPIISYGIEQLIKHGKFRMYVIFMALTLMSNFYIGYMVCIYAAAYFVYYYFATNTDNINNPHRERMHFFKSFVRFAFYSVLSVGIAAVILLGAYYALSFGKNTFSNPSWAFGFKFDVIELLVKFFPGSYDTVRPEGLPFVYCGVLTLILIPVYFLSPKFRPREKVMSGVLISFFVLSFSITVVDLVWHGFQRPNWLNYRYSFMLIFFLLTLAAQAFNEIRSVSSRTVFAICTSLAALVIFIQTLDYKYVDDLQTIWFSLAAISGYLIILCLLKVTKHKENILLILTFVICFELFGNALSNVVALDKDVVYSSYSSYNDFIKAFRPTVDNLLESDTSFYRMEKTLHRKTNDNMALGIRGLSNSTSTLNSDTIELLSRLGYSSRSHWSSYAGGTPVNDSLLGLKYIISNDDFSDYYSVAYEVGTYKTWINPYALSLAYGVDERITNINPAKYITPFEYLNALLSAMVGEDDIIPVFVPVEITTTAENPYCDRSFIAGHIKYAKTSDTNEASVQYYFNAPTSRELFYYQPSDYKREVSLRVNGSSLGSFFGGYSATRIVSLGKFEAGKQVALSMTLVSNDLYIKNGYDSIYYIDMAAFKNVMSRLSAVQYNIEKFTPDYFKGTLTSHKDAQIIQTTLPYDEGWNVYVDDDKVEVFETLDSLLAFRVDSGEHQIVLRYMPKIIVIGASVSGGSILVALLLFALHRKLLIKDRADDDEGDREVEPGTPDNEISSHDSAIVTTDAIAASSADTAFLPSKNGDADIADGGDNNDGGAGIKINTDNNINVAENTNPSTSQADAPDSEDAGTDIL